MRTLRTAAAGRAAREWNLLFPEPGLLNAGVRRRGLPGVRTPPGDPAAVGSRVQFRAPAAGGRCRSRRPPARSRRSPRQGAPLQDVRAPRPAARAARRPPLLAAVLQRPAVPGRGLRDSELGVLGRHQRGGRGAGQRFHRGGAARAAGGLGQHLAAQLPGLGAQGGRAPAAPARRRPRQAAPRAAWDVLLPARERSEAAPRHRPLPGPRQRLGLSGHRVRPREGKPPHGEPAAGACLAVTWGRGNASDRSPCSDPGLTDVPSGLGCTVDSA